MSSLTFYQSQAAEDMASSLIKALREGKLAKVGRDEVMAAVIGFNACIKQLDKPMTKEAFDALFEMTIRQTVMKA